MFKAFQLFFEKCFLKRTSFNFDHKKEAVSVPLNEPNNVTAKIATPLADAGGRLARGHFRPGRAADSFRGTRSHARAQEKFQRRSGAGDG